ncbi:hypothetical protein [uncultured Altibacter sp.]|uniref:hypothetical protein n=1 Tax=uncultured Altibacter sp. TaxID=2506933 RepID=UPI0030D960B6
MKFKITQTQKLTMYVHTLLVVVCCISLIFMCYEYSSSMMEHIMEHASLELDRWTSAPITMQ